MTKNSLGELKLSPLKENGKFVFINNEIRVNNKLNKGDYIKIFVEAYEQQNGKYLVKDSSSASAKMVVRGNPLLQELTGELQTIDDLYDKASELYKNQFYFGKTEI